MDFLKSLGHPKQEIRLAWIAACIVAAFTLFAGVVGVMKSWYMLIVVVVLGLAYGIYRASRVCAIVMLLLYVTNGVLSSIRFRKVPEGEVFFLTIAFILGVHGTIDLHKSRREDKLDLELKSRYSPPESSIHSPEHE